MQLGISPNAGREKSARFFHGVWQMGEHYAPQFQEWSEWKARPRCRFDLDLKAGSAMDLSHLNLFKNAAKLFSLRMRAHLALGDSSSAYADFLDGFHAYRALVEEPTLISGLER